MVPINKLYFHLKGFAPKNKPLYLFFLVLFFYTIFDGILSFVFPLAIQQNGYSKTMIGIIIGGSSVAGGIFDFIISRYIRNTHFRRIYILMFIICFLAPAVLWAAKPVWIFLIASGLWGMYYDLYHFGRFDFLSRATTSDGHSGSFGLSYIFTSLGYMIAPILAGLVIGNYIDWKPYLLMYSTLLISIFFFCLLLYAVKKRKDQYYANQIYKPINFLKELHLWKKIGKIIFPLLIFTLLINAADAFFWTIGPLFSENFKDIQPFNGLFLTLYELPPLLVGWFIGSVTLRYGKKRTAYFAFIIGSLILISFAFIQSFAIFLLVIFLSSVCIAIAWPSLNAAYVDYICEARGQEEEIEALNDFFSNLGFIIGPVSAGILADNFGNQNAFAVLGFIGVIVALILWRKTPKEITIKV